MGAFIVCLSVADYLYTGTADGKIVEIHKGKLRTLTRLGKEPCGNNYSHTNLNFQKFDLYHVLSPVQSEGI